jgi:hypothetical protein
MRQVFHRAEAALEQSLAEMTIAQVAQDVKAIDACSLQPPAV